MPPPTLIGDAPPLGKYLKVSMFFRKHPSITSDYFHAYWANNHVQPLLSSAKFKERVRKYNQLHVTPELKAQAETLGPPILDYDGVAEIWVESLEDWFSIVKDPEFRKAGAADAEHFITTPAQIMLGYDYLVIGDT